MKTTLVITSLLAAGLSLGLVTGCKKAAEKPAVQSLGSVPQKLDKAAATANDASQQLREYTYAERAEFVATMKTQLAALNQNLDSLSTTIATSGAEVKAEAAPKLAALREQAKQLDRQLGQIADATPSTWNGIKADSEKAYAALKDGFTQSRQWVSDKIAP